MMSVYELRLASSSETGGRWPTSRSDKFHRPTLVGPLRNRRRCQASSQLLAPLASQSQALLTIQSVDALVVHSPTFPFEQRRQPPIDPKPGFRPEFLDFDRGIRVGNLKDNERISRMLKRFRLNLATEKHLSRSAMAVAFTGSGSATYLGQILALSRFPTMPPNFCN